MVLIYSFIIHLLYLLSFPVALFHPKTRRWISGRIGWKKQLKQWEHNATATFWFHSASLGEFEQGRPVWEELKKQVPGCKLILTFYSPSGFDVRKNYPLADFIGYLPLDTAYNARAFLDIVKPDAAFFIKYEFWHFYLQALHASNIPVYLVSGIFRPKQIFFRWYGHWFRKELNAFRHLFIQDTASAYLLNTIDVTNTTIAGDTRFDRVAAIAANSGNIEIAEAFSANSFCIVAGSTWTADEEILTRYINGAPAHIKLIVAPHELDTAHMRRLSGGFIKQTILYSAASVNNISDKQILIIDNIGMLSSLYKYGKIAYIGGGFGKGIHNILEAAVFGLPVIFGPRFDKFKEATEMLAAGAAFPIQTFDEFYRITELLTTEVVKYKNAAKKAREYVMNNTGATGKITKHIIQDLIEA